MPPKRKPKASGPKGGRSGKRSKSTQQSKRRTDAKDNANSSPRDLTPRGVVRLKAKRLRTEARSLITVDPVRAAALSVAAQKIDADLKAGRISFDQEEKLTVPERVRMSQLVDAAVEQVAHDTGAARRDAPVVPVSAVEVKVPDPTPPTPSSDTTGLPAPFGQLVSKDLELLKHFSLLPLVWEDGKVKYSEAQLQCYLCLDKEPITKWAYEKKSIIFWSESPGEDPVNPAAGPRLYLCVVVGPAVHTARGSFAIESFVSALFSVSILINGWRHGRRGCPSGVEFRPNCPCPFDARFELLKDSGYLVDPPPALHQIPLYFTHSMMYVTINALAHLPLHGAMQQFTHNPNADHWVRSRHAFLCTANSRTRYGAFEVPAHRTRYSPSFFSLEGIRKTNQLDLSVFAVNDSVLRSEYIRAMDRVADPLFDIEEIIDMEKDLGVHACQAATNKHPAVEHSAYNIAWHSLPQNLKFMKDRLLGMTGPTGDDGAAGNPPSDDTHGDDEKRQDRKDTAELAMAPDHGDRVAFTPLVGTDIPQGVPEDAPPPVDYHAPSLFPAEAARTSDGVGFTHAPAVVKAPRAFPRATWPVPTIGSKCPYCPDGVVLADQCLSCAGVASLHEHPEWPTVAEAMDEDYGDSSSQSGDSDEDVGEDDLTADVPALHMAQPVHFEAVEEPVVGVGIGAIEIPPPGPDDLRRGPVAPVPNRGAEIELSPRADEVPPKAFAAADVMEYLGQSEDAYNNGVLDTKKDLYKSRSVCVIARRTGPNAVRMVVELPFTMMAGDNDWLHLYWPEYAILPPKYSRCVAHRLARCESHLSAIDVYVRARKAGSRKIVDIGGSRAFYSSIKAKGVHVTAPVLHVSDLFKSSGDLLEDAVCRCVAPAVCGRCDSADRYVMNHVIYHLGDEDTACETIASYCRRAKQGRVTSVHLRLFGPGGDLYRGSYRWERLSGGIVAVASGNDSSYTHGNIDWVQRGRHRLEDGSWLVWQSEPRGEATMLTDFMIAPHTLSLPPEREAPHSIQDLFNEKCGGFIGRNIKVAFQDTDWEFIADRNGWTGDNGERIVYLPEAYIAMVRRYALGKRSDKVGYANIVRYATATASTHFPKTNVQADAVALVSAIALNDVTSAAALNHFADPVTVAWKDAIVANPVHSRLNWFQSGRYVKMYRNCGWGGNLAAALVGFLLLFILVGAQMVSRAHSPEDIPSFFKGPASGGIPTTGLCFHHDAGPVNCSTTECCYRAVDLVLMGKPIHHARCDQSYCCIKLHNSAPEPAMPSVDTEVPRPVATRLYSCRSDGDVCLDLASRNESWLHMEHRRGGLYYLDRDPCILEGARRLIAQRRCEYNSSEASDCAASDPLEYFACLWSRLVDGHLHSDEYTALDWHLQAAKFTRFVPSWMSWFRDLLTGLRAWWDGGSSRSLARLPRLGLDICAGIRSSAYSFFLVGRFFGLAGHTAVAGGVFVAALLEEVIKIVVWSPLFGLAEMLHRFATIGFTWWYVAPFAMHCFVTPLRIHHRIFVHFVYNLFVIYFGNLWCPAFSPLTISFFAIVLLFFCVSYNVSRLLMRGAWTVNEVWNGWRQVGEFVGPNPPVLDGDRECHVKPAPLYPGSKLTRIDTHFEEKENAGKVWPMLVFDGTHPCRPTSTVDQTLVGIAVRLLANTPEPVKGYWSDLYSWWTNFDIQQFGQFPGWTAWPWARWNSKERFPPHRRQQHEDARDEAAHGIRMTHATMTAFVKAEKIGSINVGHLDENGHQAKDTAPRIVSWWSLCCTVLLGPVFAGLLDACRRRYSCVDAPLVWTVGMTNQQLGSAYEAALQRISSWCARHGYDPLLDVTVTEGDGIKFDAHWGNAVLAFFKAWLRRRGVSETLISLLAMLICVVGKTFSGIWFIVSHVMASGVPWTTLANTLVNGAIVSRACWCMSVWLGIITPDDVDLPFTVFVAGDDLLIVHVKGICEHQQFKQLLEESGFEYELCSRNYPNLNKSSYNSGFFWPFKHADGSTRLCWGPMLGRTFSRFGYAEKDTRRLVKNLLRCAALSLADIGMHVPFVRVIAEHCLHLTTGCKPMEERFIHPDAIMGSEPLSVAEFDHPWHGSTWSMLEDIYGLTKQDEQDFRARLSKVSQLPFRVGERDLVEQVCSAELYGLQSSFPVFFRL